MVIDNKLGHNNDINNNNNNNINNNNENNIINNNNNNSRFQACRLNFYLPFNKTQYEQLQK